uniref:Uncharacterized protein n=1 Tax=Timema tahoe TaxID=61484 RepID=A0A7R9IIK4_9NEOP|nr:unnamed protein product [Timema tahoe]
MSYGVQNRELVSTPAQASNGRNKVIGNVLFSTWTSVTGDDVQLITVDFCPVSVTLQNRLFLCNGTATSRLTNVDHHRCKANAFPQGAIPWHKFTWNLLSSNRKTCSILHSTETRTLISPSSVVWLITTSALANYATEAGVIAKHGFLKCVYTASRLKCRQEEALFLNKIAETLSNMRVYSPMCTHIEIQLCGSSHGSCSGPLILAAILVLALYRLRLKCRQEEALFLNKIAETLSNMRVYSPMCTHIEIQLCGSSHGSCSGPLILAAILVLALYRLSLFKLRKIITKAIPEIKPGTPSSVGRQTANLARVSDSQVAIRKASGSLVLYIDMESHVVNLAGPWLLGHRARIEAKENIWDPRSPPLFNKESWCFMQNYRRISCVPGLSPTSHRDTCVAGTLSYLPPRHLCCRDSLLPPTATPVLPGLSPTSHHDTCVAGTPSFYLSTLPSYFSLSPAIPRDGLHPPLRQSPPREDPEEHVAGQTILHSRANFILP